MYVVITFDVEDYTSPESEGIDDIPKWLAWIMSEENVTGTFFVIGEKARSLEKRERYDVISAMAEHDIGSHTNYGSIHPTVTEILEDLKWEAGVSQMLAQESAGINDLERIFEIPVTTLARHGGSYGPQLVNALGKLNAGYVGSPVFLPGKNVVWFCNTLNFSNQYSGFDDYYYRDDLFEPVYESLKREFPKFSQKVDYISLFAGHPCKIRTEQFWDFNYYYGVNTDSSEWKTPDLRSLESMETAKKNFRRLIQFLKNQKDFELTNYSQLMQLYSTQKNFITKKDLYKIAERTIAGQTIPINEYFSPAEVFFGFAQSIAEYHNKGSIPKRISRNSPLGPETMPDSIPQISNISIDEVYELAQKTIDYINNTNKLPSMLKIRNSRIGAGSLFALFSTVYLDMKFKKVQKEYRVFSFDRYPKTNEQEILSRISSYKSWPVHRPDLDMSNLINITRLQLWTLKPAHKR